MPDSPAVDPMRVTQDQFDIMFLMVNGWWGADVHPLGPVRGWYLGYDVCLTPARVAELRMKTIAADMARRALA